MSETPATRRLPLCQRWSASERTSFVRNLALTSLRLGICYLRREEPDVDRGASAIGEAVRLAAHNRSVRLVERLQWGWRELEPWRDTPAAGNVRDQMLYYGIA